MVLYLALGNCHATATFDATVRHLEYYHFLATSTALLFGSILWRVFKKVRWYLDCHAKKRSALERENHVPWRERVAKTERFIIFHRGVYISGREQNKGLFRASFHFL